MSESTCIESIITNYLPFIHTFLPFKSLNNTLLLSKSSAETLLIEDSVIWRYYYSNIRSDYIIDSPYEHMDNTVYNKHLDIKKENKLISMNNYKQAFLDKYGRYLMNLQYECLCMCDIGVDGIPTCDYFHTDPDDFIHGLVSSNEELHDMLELLKNEKINKCLLEVFIKEIENRIHCLKQFMRNPEAYIKPCFPLFRKRFQIWNCDACNGRHTTLDNIRLNCFIEYVNTFNLQ